MDSWNGAKAVLCAGIAGLAAVASGFGVFARGDGSYMETTSERGVTYLVSTSGVYAHNAQRIVAEGVGWDIFTLAVVVPALLLAGYFVLRGSPRGRLAALGLLGYFLYAYLEYAVTWAFGPLFPLFVVITAGSLVGMGWLAADVAADASAEPPLTQGFPRRSWVALNASMALLLVAMWSARIAAALGGEAEAAGLTSETTLTIQALDLGLVVPISLMLCVLVWRRSALGTRLAAAWTVTFVAMAAAIVGMLLSAWAVEGTLEIVPVVIFGVAATLGAAIAVRAIGGMPSARRAAAMRPRGAAA